MSAVTINPSIGRPQFLGLLRERMVQRLAVPAMLHDVLRSNLGRVAGGGGDPELVLRATVLDAVRRPTHVMALYEAARRAPPALNSTNLGFLGVADALGSGLAHVKLAELARGDDVVSRAAREILRYSKTMRVAARLPYSLRFLAMLERIKNDFFIRLAAQLNRQTDRQTRAVELVE